MTVIKKIYSIYLNYLINFISLNLFLILLYVFDYKTLMLNMALFGSFVILLCQIFSANSRSLILSKKKSIEAKNIIFQRILFLVPIILLSILFISFYNISDYSLALGILFVLVLNWIYEISLTKIELNNKKIQLDHLIFSAGTLLGIIISFYISNFILLKFFIFSYSFFIVYKIFYFLRYDGESINLKYIFDNVFKNSFFISSFGSSLAISVSNFFFRYFIINLTNSEISSAVIIGYMFGSFPVSLFFHIFGPSIIKNNFNLNKVIKYFDYFTLMVFLLIISLYFFELTDIFNYFQNNLITITAILSFMGLIPMISGLYKRQKNIQESDLKDNFFYQDIIFSLLVIINVPFVYILNDINLYSFCFLLSGFFSYLIFNLSDILNKKKLIKYLLLSIPIPIFINLFEFFFINIYNSDIAERTNLLPLPISIIFLPIIVLALLKTFKVKIISIYFFVTSFIFAIFSVIYLSRLTFINFLNFSQFYLPMLALIAGELCSNNTRLKIYFFKYLFWTSIIIIVSQINYSIFQDNLYLNNYLFKLNVYQNYDYSSSVFCVGLFSILLYLGDKALYSKKLNYYIITFVLLAYIYIVGSIHLYILLILYSIVILYFINFNILKNIKLITILFITTNFFIYNIDDIIRLTSNIFTSNFKFFYEISTSPQTFFFGSNLNNQIYKEVNGIYNFYLDFIYNFGFLSLLPIIILIVLTTCSFFFERKKILNSQTEFGHYIFLVFIFFIDSFLRVSFKQPYIGIIFYFLWGLYLPKIIKIFKFNV